jgi:hypothetical protein
MTAEEAHNRALQDFAGKTAFRKSEGVRRRLVDEAAVWTQGSMEESFPSLDPPTVAQHESRSAAPTRKNVALGVQRQWPAMARASLATGLA